MAGALWEEGPFYLAAKKARVRGPPLRAGFGPAQMPR